MILKKLPYIAGIVMLAFLAGCDSNSIYDKYQPIDDALWHKDSILVFDVPVSNTIQNHNILVNIRNDVNYNYSNLWLFIELEQPGGKTVTDTFELSLAEPSGKWLGEGFGNVKTRQVVYKRNVQFPQVGEYHIRIRQGMREELLEGIHEVGVRVEKTGT